MDSGLYFQENQTVAVFGGKIVVSASAVNQGRVCVKIAESNDMHEIGKSILDCKSEEVLEKKDEILLIFKDVESIDVVITAMEFVKEQLKKVSHEKT